MTEHLRKNEYDYHLCPMCNRALLYESDPQIPYCPQYVAIQPNALWLHYAHYIQYADNGFAETYYRAIIPPFRISWNESTHHLLVQQLEIDPLSLYTKRHHLFSQDNVEYEELLKIYTRLSNLKAFS